MVWFFPLAAVLVIAGIMAVVNLIRSPLTLDSAYNRYMEAPERSQDDLKRDKGECWMKNIAIMDIDGTDIPDVMYITYDDEVDPY